MSYFEDQEEAWFEGGREWYIKQNRRPLAVEGIPSDFDPFEFWADTQE